MHETADILIVDDDQNMRLTLSEILSKEGYQVETASTGEEAVELCRSKIYRVVLMDVRMPGIDGFEAYRQIRQHCRRSQIILMSAYSNSELEILALQQGVLAFLQKPLDIESVLSLITRVTSTAVLYAGNISEYERGLARDLVSQGFMVTLAVRADEAMSRIEQVQYDTIIIDCDTIRGPSLDGVVAFAQQVRPGIAVVYALEPATADEATAPQGAMAILQKPIQLEALLTLLEQVKRQRLGVCPPEG